MSKPATALNGKQEMVELAEANPDFLGSTIGFWDPFNLIAEGDFWGLGNEATIGYLRHAEIKHGRVAMAGFLGFCLQSLPVVAGDHILKPYSGYVSNVSPQEQWENVPAIGKLQILVLVGMLESYGEGAGSPAGYVHYTQGGKPGFFPSIKGKGGFAGGTCLFDLYDPFGILPEQTEAEKKKGLFAEINNGRLAMIGLFSVLAESAVPGSNPQYAIFDIKIPESSVDIMGSVFPQLTNEFAVKAWPVLALCGFLQQYNKRKTV